MRRAHVSIFLQPSHVDAGYDMFVLADAVSLFDLIHACARACMLEKHFTIQRFDFDIRFLQIVRRMDTVYLQDSCPI